MAKFKRPEYELNYRWDGNQNAPILVLSHSLGANLSMWDAQVEELKDDYYILRYDHPGHGESGMISFTPSIADLGLEVIALFKELNVEKAMFCGLSLGGMVGLWLGANAPRYFTKIAISNTAAKIADTTLLKGRIAVIRKEGLEAISTSVLDKWFTPEFQDSEMKEKAKKMLLDTASNGYAALAETVCYLDLFSDLGKINIPFLIMYGSKDEATPKAWSEQIYQHISPSVLQSLPAAHMANMEVPEKYTKKLKDFF